MSGPLDRCAEVRTQDDANLSLGEMFRNSPGLSSAQKGDLKFCALLLELLLELDETDDLITVIDLDNEGKLATGDISELCVAGGGELEGLPEGGTEVGDLGRDSGEEG